MLTARIVEAVDVFEDRHLSVAARPPGPVPQKLGLDRLEEGFDGSVEAPIFVKPRSGTILGRKAGYRFRGRCSVSDNE